MRKLRDRVGHSGLFGWVVAGGCLAGAVAVERLTAPAWHGVAPYILFVLPAAVMAWQKGSLPGMATMLAGGALAGVFLPSPHARVLPSDVAGWAQLLSYLVVSLGVVLLISAPRRGGRGPGPQGSSAFTPAEMEQRVGERTAELELANRELEAFSYSVSHDLKAPLRTINAFSQAVLEDYRDRLDQQAVTCLEYIVEASARLRQLIEDLLALAHIARSGFRPEQIDLSALAASIIRELQKTEPDRGLDIRITSGLQAWGDPGLLRIALDNLLANAWKFTRKQSHPQIEVGTLPREAVCVFYIRDNGVGFNMTHSDRLFNPFQRLHPAEEFPGTGVGLAIVKRIIDRHGGKVWVEAQVGQGATFYFTLPRLTQGGRGGS